MADAGEKARELFIERNAIQAELGGLPRIAGRLIGIDPFDQPAVELAKVLTRERLAKPAVPVTPKPRKV